ncbi:MAG: secondary thiamine-phosphate synthase enzyme YjbQ [Phycisphaerales bacterium]|nr:secondary thiamine-phosphate synthase enzyme YjbQ [Phycisphaerales bacterium]
MPVKFSIQTDGKGLHEITREVAVAVQSLTRGDGLCTIFVQHTSASLTIQENADPTARADLESWLDRIAPEDDPAYTHTSEGPDDMPSHIRSMVTDVSVSIPVCDGTLMLGTWQGVNICEHRRASHSRQLIVVVTPEIPS